MNIIAVDDNMFALNSLTNELKTACPDDTVYSFRFPSRALEFVNNECDGLFAAFLDVEMPGITGIELAIRIKMRFPHTIIIFVTAYTHYSLNAFKIHANGYLVKPVSSEMLSRELKEITQPYISPVTKRIRAQTFGNFELFVDGVPVKFARSKSKELVAYLIDRRGALCAMGELAAVLFGEYGDEKTQQSYLRHLISDVKSTLSSLNAEDIIIKERNGIALDVSEIDCDFLRLLSGDPAATNAFLGEYMTNYSWAEFSIGEIIKAINR